jgi:hypothetical protein
MDQGCQISLGAIHIGTKAKKNSLNEHKIGISGLKKYHLATLPWTQHRILSLRLFKRVLNWGNFSHPS